MKKAHDNPLGGFKLKVVYSKGQLISKGLFGVLNSSKKRTKKIRLNYYDTSGRLVFLEEFEDTKKTFRN